MKAPAHSPDLNPIEYIWHSIKNYVRRKGCISSDSAKEAIEEYVRTHLTRERCQKYIRKLKKVLRNSNKIILLSNL